MLDWADGIIYAVVGACFFIRALCALGYSFWDFGTTITAAIGAGKGDPTLLAKAIIQFVSDLLLVLIIFATQPQKAPLHTTFSMLYFNWRQRNTPHCISFYRHKETMIPGTPFREYSDNFSAFPDKSEGFNIFLSMQQQRTIPNKLTPPRGFL